jgi:hypothetical protein
MKTRKKLLAVADGILSGMLDVAIQLLSKRSNRGKNLAGHYIYNIKHSAESSNESMCWQKQEQRA